MKKLVFLLLICFLTLSLVGISNAINNAYLPKLTEESPQIFKQPNGPFAVMYFCEYAQGNYIGVIYYDRMKGPINSAWKISERIWQGSEWSSDVNNFAWSPSGKYLYVATADVYGNGGLFELNLLEKTSKTIFPLKEDEIKLKDRQYLSVYIKSIDTLSKKLNAVIETDKGKFERIYSMI